MMFADPATEDDGDLVGLADCSISIKQPLPEAVQRCPRTKEDIVAELDLREEQPMLTACLRSLFRSKRRASAAPATFGRRLTAPADRASRQVAGAAQASSIW